MQNVICELVLDITAFGFYDVSNKFVYLRDTLENLDKITSKFRSKEQFFNSIKKSIHPKVSAAVEADHGFSTTDIVLGSEGIFIRKNGKKISPLYSHIGEYPLKDVVFKRMYDGSLTAFYRCDLKRCNSDLEYETFFLDFDDKSQDRIGEYVPTLQDMNYFWAAINLSNRYFTAVRFLLTNLKGVDLDDMTVMDELYESFCSLIPQTNKLGHEGAFYRRDPIKPKSREYRYPYKDDN